MAEKTGVILRVSPDHGGILFKDEPDKWYNATPTAKALVKSELRGKKVTIRLADNPSKFSFISLCSDQPEQTEQTAVDSSHMTRDDYWARKEARDIKIEQQISRQGALNTSLEAIRISALSGSSGAALKAESILLLAETLADSHVLPFVKDKRDKGDIQ